MSSAFITTAPTPNPPPTVMPAHLSNPDFLFSLFIPSLALDSVELFVVFTYFFVLIALTNCLDFWDIFSIRGMAVFCATLVAPINWTIACVILPDAVFLASSSAWFSILPSIVFSNTLLNFSAKPSSILTSLPAACFARSVINKPKLITPFGILIKPLTDAPAKDSVNVVSLYLSDGIPTCSVIPFPLPLESFCFSYSNSLFLSSRPNLDPLPGYKKLSILTLAPPSLSNFSRASAIFFFICLAGTPSCNAFSDIFLNS